jgi:hypothetical protein
LLLFLLPSPFTGLLFCQKSKKTAEFDGVFAYAIKIVTSCLLFVRVIAAEL